MLGAVALALLCAAATAAAALPRDVVLNADQIGAGYRLQMRPDSHCTLACVTLDLCGFHYRSEARRKYRLQVNYVHPGRTVQVSNEVVTYRPGGIGLAMHELRRSIATCPKGPVMGDVQGVGPVTYRLTRVGDPRLLPGFVAVLIHVHGLIDGKVRSETNLAVYQARGNTLSIVYTYGSARLTGAEQIRVGLHAAEGSADNLGRAIRTGR